MTSPSVFNPASKRVLNCVLVEDQAMFLELLAGLLQLRGGLRIAAKALTVAEGIRACTKHSPDLLILDLELPDGDGLRVAKRLAKIQPSAKILILSAHANTFYCPARLRKSIHAVVDKTQSYDALRIELDGLLPRPASGAAAPVLEKKRFVENNLTARESEIFALLGEGLTSRQIGVRLFVSEQTVQTHRKRIAAKLGTRGPELLKKALEHRQAFFSGGNHR